MDDDDDDVWMMMTCQVHVRGSWTHSSVGLQSQKIKLWVRRAEAEAEEAAAMVDVAGLTLASSMSP